MYFARASARAVFACIVGLIVLIIDELEISSRMVVNLSNLIIFTQSYVSIKHWRNSSCEALRKVGLFLTEAIE